MVNQIKSFVYKAFSLKQKQVLTWWLPESKYCNKDAIICDGSVRAGKTIIMSLSFVLWSMFTFSNQQFGMAGKTIGSFRRNVILVLKLLLRLRGYKVFDHRSENYLEISRKGVSNLFFIFGGKDERSQDLVQGFTSAGFFFDEVVLMPQSFVNQAVARCSVEGAKLWFNCNPDGPFHWFKLEWIDQLLSKNAIRIHFELDDNPSLSEKVKARYKRMFGGVFYDRFILGLWVVAEGIIYSMFRNHMIVRIVPLNVVIRKKWIGVDYGQSNATVFLLIGLGSDDKLYILSEYYHEGRSSQEQKSPSKYSKDFKLWLIKCGVEGMPVRYDDIFIDPSAKGFMLQLFEEGVKGLKQANNEVLRGIELISSIIDNDMLRILSCCENTIKEFGAYSWDPKAQKRGEDIPIKQFDHALDGLRYVINGTRITWQRIIVHKQKAA